MLKFDRTAHSAGNIHDKRREVDHYKGMTLDQLGEVFAFLQSVAYNYSPSQPPRMDKSIHHCR